MPDRVPDRVPDRGTGQGEERSMGQKSMGRTGSPEGEEKRLKQAKTREKRD